MATEIIHEQAAPASDSSNVMGLILGIVLFFLLAFLLFYFLGAGRLLGGFRSPQVNVYSTK